MNSELFPPEFLQLLHGEGFMPMRTALKRHAGQQLSTGAGDSREFQDFRPYVPGDDMRYLDWNIFRRSGKFFLKRFRHYPQADHLITLDTSASMRFTPQRAASAWRVTAMLGARLLHGGDRIALRGGAGGAVQRVRPGNDAVWLWCEALSRLFDEAGSSRHPVYSGGGAGHHWIVSDFYDPRGLEHLERRLRHAGFTPVRIFDREEMSPSISGEMTLADSETAERIQVDAASELLARYREALAHFEAVLGACAHRTGSRLYRIETTSAWHTLYERFQYEFSQREE